MKRQTNPPIARETGLRFWDIGIVLINMLLAINGVIFIVVMFNFLRWGAERVFYDDGRHKKVNFNEYSAKNFFVYNVPIMLLGSISVFTSIAGFSMRFCYKKKHKTDLIIQMGLLAYLFVFHLILLTFTLAWWPNLEKNYHSSLQETVKIISEQRNEYLETECNYMRELSKKFSCCGYDVEDANVVGWNEHGKFCCDVFENKKNTSSQMRKTTAPGCFEPSLDHIRAYHNLFFVIPSGFSLACELVLAFDWFIIYRKRYSPQVQASITL
jgi:hypothetical protein